MRWTGLSLLVVVALLTVGAGSVAPHEADSRFDDLLYAPPTRVRVVGPDGDWRRPFVYPWRLVNRLERRFEEDRSRPVPLRWFTGGHLVGTADTAAPLLLLGADGFGRDIWSRLLYAARTSLSLAVVATVGAMLLGLLLGGVAGFVGGSVDSGVSRLAEIVLVLPAMYVVLALRAVMPLVLPARDVFFLMTAIFALVGWPFAARGVRAIVMAERQRDYVTAAHALGASPLRVLGRHLLPATRGFLAVQATLLLPAFILAEATLSYVGLGFPAPTPTWGTMLRDAANVTLLGGAPWALAPAVAIFICVLAVNLVCDAPAGYAVPGSRAHR